MQDESVVLEYNPDPDWNLHPDFDEISGLWTFNSSVNIFRHTNFKLGSNCCLAHRKMTRCSVLSRINFAQAGSQSGVKIDLDF